MISLGGSIVLSGNNLDTLVKLADLLERLSEKYKLYIVIGGGRIAREYIQLGRKLSLPEQILDELGIDVTRINAKLFTHLLNDTANKIIPKTTDEAVEVAKPIVVMGGTTPGHSTDQVGAELASKIKASRFIIATNVDGVYDKDPNVYSDAKLLPVIHVRELIELYGVEWREAGGNVIIDGPALDIIQRNRITTMVVNGGKLEELEKAIKGLPTIHGTKILVD